MDNSQAWLAIKLNHFRRLHLLSLLYLFIEDEYYLHSSLYCGSTRRIKGQISNKKHSIQVISFMSDPTRRLA